MYVRSMRDVGGWRAGVFDDLPRGANPSMGWWRRRQQPWNFDVPSNHVTRILLINLNTLSMPCFNFVSHLRQHRAASEVPNSLAMANFHAIRPRHHNVAGGNGWYFQAWYR
jgi:hypothetical protein